MAQLAKRKINDAKLNPVFNVTNAANNASIIHANGNESNEIIRTSSNDGFSDYIGSDLFRIPNWNIKDFIYERIKFKTQGMAGSTASPYNDPGLFFYKLFFNFNTGFGLFGSLIKTTNNKYISDDNSAWQYLTNNIMGNKFSKNYRAVLLNKRKSLETFAKLLNYLTLECPWFFKEITGLEEALQYKFNNIVVNDSNRLILVFNEDAVDMRISTLINLYKDACFDYKNFKEVIPENLRKFDMSVLIFNPPIYGVNLYKGYNTQFSSTNGDNLTFKCIIFKNCEFDYEKLTCLPTAINNAEGNKLSLSMPLKFERVYVYDVNNEFDTKTLDNLYNDEDIGDINIFDRHGICETDTDSYDNYYDCEIDIDSDGIEDSDDDAICIVDTDLDGVEDPDDDGNCDTDSDDGCEGDYDGDGVPDNADCEEDSDGDGVPDNADCEEDSDGDGVPEVDGCVEDINGDGIPGNDDCVEDINGDGNPENDNCPEDSNGDGNPENDDPEDNNCSDYDGDGVPEDNGCVDYNGDGNPENDKCVEDYNGDGDPENDDPEDK